MDMKREELFNQTELAALLKVPLWALALAISRGDIPHPPHAYKGRLYYHISELPDIRRKVGEGAICPRTTKKLLTARGVAKLLGLTYQRAISALKEKGKLNGMGRMIGKRLYYTAEEAEKIRELLIQHQIDYTVYRKDVNLKRREDAGLYSQKQAAKALGIPGITFQYHLTRGNLPRPTHLYGCLLCYDAADIEKMRLWLKENYKKDTYKG